MNRAVGPAIVVATLLAACGGNGASSATSSSGSGGTTSTSTAATSNSVTSSSATSSETSSSGTASVTSSSASSTSSTSSSSSSGGSGGPFPLRTSANHRYLVDAKGNPFLLMGDAPQCLTARISTADMDVFFAAREAQSFNAAWVNALCTTYTGGKADATTYDGVAPFTKKLSGSSAYDLSAPNPDFFARVDAAVASAAAHGIVLFLDPIETGGFLDTLRANGLTAARNYGRYIGGRYASQDNIVWLHGNDFQTWRTDADDLLVQAVALGILELDQRHLHTIELDYNISSSLDDAAHWASPSANILGINATYTYSPTYAQAYKDYNRTNFLPSVMIEANYEGESNASAPHTTNAHDCRTQYYWTILSGETGSFYGNHHIWPLDDTWKDHLDDPGAVQAAHVQTVFGSRAWYALVPDQTHTVVVSGIGNYDVTNQVNAQDNTYATTARTGDGTLVMTYMPTARAIGVDMTKLASAAEGRWFDPTTGAYTSIAGSPFANAGTKTFTPPSDKHADGFDDWVLVLETKAP